MASLHTCSLKSSECESAHRHVPSTRCSPCASESNSSSLSSPQPKTWPRAASDVQANTANARRPFRSEITLPAPPSRSPTWSACRGATSGECRYSRSGALLSFAALVCFVTGCCSKCWLTCRWRTAPRCRTPCFPAHVQFAVCRRHQSRTLRSARQTRFSHTCGAASWGR